MLGPVSTTLQSCTDITAVILAGGLGSRMQSTDKGLLQWRGRSFIAHLLEQLSAQCDHLAVNTNSSAAELKNFGVPLLRDPFPDRRGPLAGILAGLDYSTTEYTLFVPCDNPLLPADLAARLLGALRRQDASIAYAASNADRHYLYALLRSDVRPRLESFLDRGDFAVRRWYATENAIPVAFDDAADCFLNINTAADLERLPR